MNLRPHQITAVEMLRASLRSGKKRPILAAPCSLFLKRAYYAIVDCAFFKQ